MFVITALAVIGLPMLNSFVGEFLILSGSMQASFAHHHFWTALAATGVILSAAYMLTMIQRVFYGDLGPKPRRSPHGISTRASTSHSGRWSRCF